MALATTVLSHGLADLVLFFIFFMYIIFSFSQYFFLQLGPFMEEYNSQLATLLSLFRGLFGDFDIASVMNTSSSWGNAIVLMMYLLGSIFILLSIFLTILGEHQGYVREEEVIARENGTATAEWGVFDARARPPAEAHDKGSLESARAHGQRRRRRRPSASQDEEPAETYTTLRTVHRAEMLGSAACPAQDRRRRRRRPRRHPGHATPGAQPPAATE